MFIVELVVGLSLLTGTATRLGAAIGLLLALNLGVGLLDVPGEWPWSYAMLAMWHGLFVVSGPGRVWGVDEVIVRSDPSALAVRLAGPGVNRNTVTAPKARMHTP